MRNFTLFLVTFLKKQIILAINSFFLMRAGKKENWIECWWIKEFFKQLDVIY